MAWNVCPAPADAEDGKSNGDGLGVIQHIDLINLSHTDYGFTDHPVVCREMQRRYVDIAIDAAAATANKPSAERFYWTAETTVPVADWWKTATESRREAFLKAVKSGQIEVTALPMNQTPTLNRQQWNTMLHWLPEDLWKQVQPKAAAQNDVNGVPRAGALALLDRGVHYLFTGVNETSGGAPVNVPSGFWWKMPNGRKLFVWVGYSYCAGYSFFEPDSWRRGPVPMATDTRYRPPRPNEILPADEASVRKAHGHVVDRLRAMEAGGYRNRTLLISMTNEWRIDNDPPFPPLAEFVAAWNRLGLKPTLRFTTLAPAMQHMEEEIGKDAPVYEGEWTDWWANGVASGPREVAASRVAKRFAAAAESPLWGPLDDNAKKALQEIYRELCLFDEHTWGDANSVALPDDLETLGQYNEKSRYAYRAVALSRLLLSQRVRTQLANQEEGFYVANTARAPWSGWGTMLTTCLRDDYKSVDDPRSGVRMPIEFRNGLQQWGRPTKPEDLTPQDRAATFADNMPRLMARFWVDKLDGAEVRRLQLKTDAVDAANAAAPQGPAVTTDENGWPTGATWTGMAKPLFLPGVGDFTVARVKGFAPRWIAEDIMQTRDDAQRAKRRAESVEEVAAQAGGKTTVERNGHTTVYTQSLSHPRCRWIVRQLEVWNGEPRARLTFKFDRLSLPEPEVFFIAFPLPCEGVVPRLSSGGVPYTPYSDQLRGTCRDYFAIDGWADYETPDGHWLWASRDVPLVALGETGVLAKRTKDMPKDTNRILAMPFNNIWFTNFVGDSHGVMEFQFDLAWKKELKDVAAVQNLAESLCSEPQVIINPSWKESPIFMERLYRP